MLIGLREASMIFQPFADLSKGIIKRKGGEKKNVKSFSFLICHDLQVKNYYSTQAKENKETVENKSIREGLCFVFVFTVL